MNTFAGMLAGGQSGLAIEPGKPADSLLVKKLKGQAGARMPAGKPPLADDVIAKIEKWIALGARFDGPDANQPVAEVVALVRAQSSTHEELSRLHEEGAIKNWRLTLPDAQPTRYENSNLLVLGNVGEATLAEVGQAADVAIPKLSKLLHVSASEPLIKGRLTLYVFDKHYDYAEVGTMVENREIPAESKGHSRYTIVDAYGCILPSKDGGYGLAPLVAEQIAGVWVASQGRIPYWFAEGSGLALAAKIDPKDSRPPLGRTSAQLAGGRRQGRRPAAQRSGRRGFGHRRLQLRQVSAIERQAVSLAALRRAFRHALRPGLRQGLRRPAQSSADRLRRPRRR